MSRLYSTKMAMQGAKSQVRAKEGKLEVKAAFEGMGPEEAKYGRPWSAAMSFDYGHACRMGRAAVGMTDGLKLERSEFNAYLAGRREADAKHRAGSTTHPAASNPAPRKRAGVMRKVERSVGEIQRELELLQGTKGTSKRVKTLKLELTMAQGRKDVTSVAAIKVTNT